MNKFPTLILTAALATTSATLAPFAHADTSNAPKQVLIRYADLDLTQFSGVSVLYSRLQRAARQVCAPLNSKVPEMAAAYRSCALDAMSRAVTQVDQPALSAYYRAKGHGRNVIPSQVIARQDPKKP